jgi:putative SOS response-associated peptidase YedK
MCSRITLHHPVSVLADYFKVTGGTAGAETFTSSYNIAPSHQSVIIVLDGERKFMTMEAGLVSTIDSKRYINARAETIDQLPTFRTAFRKRRCLIPMSGFYEPDHVTNSKDPYYFHLADDRPFVCAGIWERSETDVGRVCSYSVITVPANQAVSAVHDRMPAILDNAAQALWLDPSIEDPAILTSVLKPYSGDDLLIHRVDRSLYKNLSSGPECIEPLRRAEDQLSLF